MYNKINWVFETIDRGSEDWQDFIEANKIRNRITHPKSIKDIYVSNDDLKLVIKVLDWVWITIIDFSRKGEESLSEMAHHITKAYDKQKNLAT